MKTYQLLSHLDVPNYSPACSLAISQLPRLRVTYFRRSAIISGWSEQGRIQNNVLRGTRQKINTLSMRSATRLLFWLSNSPCNWYAMSTLTFRVVPKDPKAVLRKWVKQMQRHGFCINGWCWVMELQERGAEHFHVLWTEHELSRDAYYNGHRPNVVYRRGKAQTVLRGAFDTLVSRSWIAACADYESAFINFQLGGTTTLLSQDNAAAHYFGSYLGKGKNKQSKEALEANKGRWWYCSPDTRPVPEEASKLTRYPYEGTRVLVMRKEELDDYAADRKPFGRL